MNEKGQFLLYDALISIILLFIVITTVFYILNQEENITLDNDALTGLNLLSSYTLNNKNIIIAVEENDPTAIEIVNNLLSDKNYLIYDYTTNKTVLTSNVTNYKNSISAKKIIEEHEFELIYYY